MSEARDLLAAHPVSSGLSPQELDLVGAKLDVVRFAKGDAVSLADEAGQSLLFVIEGAIELLAPINERVERIIETARAGASLGQVAFFEQRAAIGLGRAAEDSTGLLMTRAAYDELYADQPGIALRVQTHLVHELCTRVRVLGGLYVHSVDWGLKVSGATQLNLEWLISEHTVVSLDLMSGASVSGTLLKVDETPTGVEIFLREGDGDLLIVPWTAVAVARIPGRMLDQVQAELAREG